MYQSDTECALARPEPAVEELRSLVAELVTALGNVLNEERDAAEESLSRAAALLRRTEEPGRPEEPRTPATGERKGSLAPWQVRRVTAHVEANLARPQRSGELAALVRLSPAHFSRTFRSTFGCSPLEYVTRRRMERAQGLMLSTDLPLAQIALDCGLADQAHFSRLFRRIVGECPRAWRRARASGSGCGSESGGGARRDENVLELRRLGPRRPLRLVAERG